jgi:hypothetical protein
VEQELLQQYYSRGRYAVQIKSQVQPLERNRVAITIEIAEGAVASISQINIVGNKAFTEKNCWVCCSRPPPAGSRFSPRMISIPSRNWRRISKPAFLLSGSGLSQVQCRIDSSFDHPG